MRRERMNQDLPEPSRAGGQNFLTVGRTDRFHEGQLAVFNVNGDRIAVAKVGGRFYAFDDSCTHKHCSLSEGDLEGTAVVCPCHGGTFDVTTGNVLAGPPPLPVRTYPVRVNEGDLQIQAGSTEAA